MSKFSDLRFSLQTPIFGARIEVPVILNFVARRDRKPIGGSMRKSTVMVYDGNVSTGGGTITTDPSFNATLGEGNQFAAQILVDLVSGTTPTFTFRVQHSCDAINWINRGASPEVNAQTITAGALTSFLVQDVGATPLLSYVRFQLTVAGTTAQAHVKVWVTTRDNA